MVTKRNKPEDHFTKLRQLDVPVAQGQQDHRQIASNKVANKNIPAYMTKLQRFGQYL